MYGIILNIGLIFFITLSDIVIFFFMPSSFIKCNLSVSIFLRSISNAEKFNFLLVLKSLKFKIEYFFGYSLFKSFFKKKNIL